MTTFYAAYDAASVYAIGTTPDAAIETARTEAREPNAQFETAQITAELAAWIDANGWDGHRETLDVRNGWLTRTTRGE